jgi:hypothetical protein
VFNAFEFEWVIVELHGVAIFQRRADEVVGAEVARTVRGADSCPRKAVGMALGATSPRMKNQVLKCFHA